MSHPTNLRRLGLNKGVLDEDFVFWSLRNPESKADKQRLHALLWTEFTSKRLLARHSEDGTVWGLAPSRTSVPAGAVGCPSAAVPEHIALLLLLSVEDLSSIPNHASIIGLAGRSWLLEKTRCEAVGVHFDVRPLEKGLVSLLPVGTTYRFEIGQLGAKRRRRKDDSIDLVSTSASGPASIPAIPSSLCYAEDGPRRYVQRSHGTQCGPGDLIRGPVVANAKSAADLAWADRREDRIPMAKGDIISQLEERWPTAKISRYARISPVFGDEAEFPEPLPRKGPAVSFSTVLRNALTGGPVFIRMVDARLESTGDPKALMEAFKGVFEKELGKGGAKSDGLSLEGMFLEPVAAGSADALSDLHEKDDADTAWLVALDDPLLLIGNHDSKRDVEAKARSFGRAVQCFLPGRFDFEPPTRKGVQGRRRKAASKASFLGAIARSCLLSVLVEREVRQRRLLVARDWTPRAGRYGFCLSTDTVGRAVRHLGVMASPENGALRFVEGSSAGELSEKIAAEGRLPIWAGRPADDHARSLSLWMQDSGVRTTPTSDPERSDWSSLATGVRHTSLGDAHLWSCARPERDKDSVHKGIVWRRLMGQGADGQILADVACMCQDGSVRIDAPSTVPALFRHLRIAATMP